MDHLAQGHQGSFPSLQVLEHQGNTLDLLQHLVGSPLVLGYLDNIHLHQELQVSFPPALELLGSTLGSIHQKELQDKYLEALLLTQWDHFLRAPELPLALIQVCLSQVASQEAMVCMGQVVQVHSHLQLDLVLSLHSPAEAFPRYHPVLGDHQQVEASQLPLVPLALVRGLWVHMVGLLPQEGHCPDIGHHIKQ